MNLEIILLGLGVLGVIIIAGIFRSKALIRIALGSFIAGLLYSLAKHGSNLKLLNIDPKNMSGWDIAFIVFIANTAAWIFSLLITRKEETTPIKKP